MNKQRVLSVIELYQKRFEELNIGKIDFPHNRLLPVKKMRESALSHTHGMLDQMEEFVWNERMDKAFRWLGFVQGVLWVLRIYTLEELKEHNRPAS